MKTAIKRENNEFLVITLKHVSCLTGYKMQAIAHENGQKHENLEFLVIPLKHVSGFTGH